MPELPPFAGEIKIRTYENFSFREKIWFLVQMNIFPLTPNWRPVRFRRDRKSGSGSGRGLVTSALLAAGISAVCFSSIAQAQQGDPAKPVVVQPGAPGAPSKTLPLSTRAILPPRSAADVEFMQGMIHHHAQAVEMTAMIPSHTQNQDLRSLGARISSSQSDEIKFMKRWLAARGESVPLGMAKMTGMDMPSMDMPSANMPSVNMPSVNMPHQASHETMPLMPGMLTPIQMDALRKARGAEFDRLFLLGMIQHHQGALTMVRDLFDTAGAGQDAELFNFATDADNSQRAEIRIMESMLKKETLQENR